jgi:hypothetical protein
MSYRNDVDALAARHAALEAEAEQAARRRDEARALLDEARRPVLENLRVASPCSEAWAQMDGDDRVRACAKCQQNVYNLSGMTRAEVETLVRDRNGGRLCVRYFQRFDGTILLADCELGRKSKRNRRFVAAGIAASVAAGISGYGMHATAKHHEVHELAGEMIMGGAPPLPIEEGTPAPQVDERDVPMPRISMKL